MSKQKDNSNSEYKQRPKLLCCSCFGRKKRSSTSTTIDFSNKNEPYDYVVEKLAIKKVPVSLFATEEDLDKHSKTVSSNSTVTPSIISQKSEKPLKIAEPIKDKPSVTFSAYYQLTPKHDIEHVSHTDIPRHNSSDIELFYDTEKEIRYQTNFQQKSPRKIISEEQEQELVAHILNKHSSLFTLDPKEPVPKDPENPPRDTTVVPSCVHAALQGRPYHQFPPLQGRRQVQVEIHRTQCPPGKPTVMPPMKYPTSVPQSKWKLTPELKETINALGTAQKPRFPGLPPKNQRNVLGTVSDGSTEQEVGCNVLAGDEVIEEIRSHEMVCHSLEPKKKVDCSRNIRKKKLSITESSCDDSEFDSYESSTPKAQYSEGTIPFETQLPRNSIVQQCNAELNNKSVLAIPERSNNQIRYSPIHESVNTSEPRMQDSEQITEISQLKGQSLKWKIIIKHHSDKKKESGAVMEKSDDSDTDVDSKQYALNRKCSSPHR